MPTPPMLRQRDPEPEIPRPDAIVSITVAGLGIIALCLLAAAILAVYTYSTPDIELPLVIAIILAFSLLTVVNALRWTMHRLRPGP